MVVYSGVTQFRNLGNGLCLSAPGGDYTNSNQLTYVACTNSWTSQFMLPQPGADMRLVFQGPTSKCVDLDSWQTGAGVDMHVSSEDCTTADN